MELVLYFFIVIVISVGSFWFLGTLYGLFRRPAIYFPMTLAGKMAISAVLGGIFFLVGGVILATLVFNGEMMKRADYQRWPTLIVGAVISIICTVIIYISAFTLAWEIIG